jgi:hypothetical protein
MKKFFILLGVLTCVINSYSQTCGTGQASAACGVGTALTAGNTSVNAGQTYYFNAGGTPTYNNVSLNGGTLRICTALTLTNFNQNSGHLIVENGGSLTLTNAGGYYPNGGSVTIYGTLSFSGTTTIGIQNGVSVFVGSSGALTNVTDLNITSGSLHVNNNTTIAGNVTMSTGSNSICIGSGAILTVNGTGTTDIQAALTINSGCALLVPNGQLTIQNTGSVSMSTGSTLQVKNFMNNTANSISGPGATTACFKYSGTATINAPLSTNPNIEVCSSETNPTQNWGSATVYPGCSGCGFSDLYWVGKGSDNKWNTNSNWGDAAGNDCAPCRPTSTTNIHFNANSQAGFNDCVVDLNNQRVNRIYINNYTGTINLNGNTLSAISNDVSGSTFNSGTITNGTLVLSNLGRTPSTLVFSGTSFGTSNANGPTLTISSPNIQFGNSAGSTFWGAVTATKTSNSGTNNGKGGNTFKSSFILTNQGTDIISLATTSADTYDGDVTLKSTSTGGIDIADNGANNFNGNIKVGSSSTGNIRFGNGGGTSSVVNGKTLSLDAIGFSGGTLQLSNVTYNHTAPLNLTLTGTAYLNLVNATFTPSVSFVAPQLSATGTTFSSNSTNSLQKTSVTDNTSGGNTFNGTTTLRNSGSAAFKFGDANPDIFNGNLILINSSTGHLHVAASSSDTEFYGNVDLQNTSTGEITFGSLSGTSNLASGKTISASAFTNGTLRIDGFRQLGNTAQSLVVTSNARILFGDVNSNIFNGSAVITANTTSPGLPNLRVYRTTFIGAATLSARDIEVNENTFQASCDITKLSGAAGNDVWDGGNTFNGAVSITNNSASRLRFPVANKEIYNSDATFTRGGTGALDPAYTSINDHAGNISVNGAVTFAGGGGFVNFIGAASQGINGTATTINRIMMSKNSAANTVTLNTPLTVGTDVSFITGMIVSSAANKIIFDVSATVSGASDNSHVNGPVQKIGTSAFEFPVGDGTNYRPIAIGAAGGSNTFTATYVKNSALTIATSLSGLDHVSNCEYWTLDRSAGASAVDVTLSWNGAACPETVAAPYVDVPADLRVARYNGSDWEDVGNTATIGAGGFASTGTVTSSPINSFSPFTLASEDEDNALPVELLYFKGKTAENGNYLEWVTASELNSEKFEIQRSQDGLLFEKIAEVKSAGTTRIKTHYNFLDYQINAERLYYRLKQIDFDGKYSFSAIISLTNSFAENTFSFFPNPSNNGKIYFNGRYSIKIINAAGAILREARDVTELDVSDLAAGLYVIRSNRGMARLIIVSSNSSRE